MIHIYAAVGGREAKIKEKSMLGNGSALLPRPWRSANRSGGCSAALPLSASRYAASSRRPSLSAAASRAAMAGVDRVPPEGVLSPPRRSDWQRCLSTHAAREKSRVCVEVEPFLLNIPQS